MKYQTRYPRAINELIFLNSLKHPNVIKTLGGRKMDAEHPGGGRLDLVQIAIPLLNPFSDNENDEFPENITPFYIRDNVVELTKLISMLGTAFV